MLLALLMAGCSDSEPFSKEGREPSRKKEGLLSAFDFVGNNGNFQLKFADGEVWLIYNMQEESQDKIRVGQTGILTFYDKIHGSNCFCGSTMAYWEITKERSNNQIVLE